MTDESDRPGTCRSKVGCEAMEEPCTNRMVPPVLAGSPAHLFHRNSFTSLPLLVQCSVPVMRNCSFMATTPPSFGLDGVRFDDHRPLFDLGLHVGAELRRRHRERDGTQLLPGGAHVRP